MQRERNRILDLLYLIGAPLLVCVLGVGAFYSPTVFTLIPYGYSSA